ncbi:MAG TPA: sulfatase-like hydrolase/transferase, partial [Clostridia bacterium]|nr:sulfatase-like hydrolase/transferase [Clostridia bacterium]
MKKPNILLFLADQHRYDCVGCSNKRAVYTPNIDKLAERGIVFDNAYCPTPVCAPARQSFMSSKRAESIGALWNFGFVNTNTVQPSDWTISKSLKDAGYENIFVGAWDISRTAPEQYGFDKTYLSKEYNRYISVRYPDIKYNNSWFGEMNPIPYSDSRPKYYSDRVCEELDR